MSKLPLEILDIILEKSILRSVIRDDGRSTEINPGLIQLLLSVESFWCERIKRARFKKQFWSRLSGEYSIMFYNYAKNRVLRPDNLQIIVTLLR